MLYIVVAEPWKTSRVMFDRVLGVTTVVEHGDKTVRVNSFGEIS